MNIPAEQNKSYLTDSNPETKKGNTDEIEAGKNEEIFTLFEKPLLLLKQGKELGVNGIKTFFIILTLFGITNFLLLIVGILTIYFTGFEWAKLSVLFGVFLLGIVHTAIAGVKTYYYILTDALRVVFENLAPYFKTVSVGIINKSESFFLKNEKSSDEKIAKAVDVGNILNEKYKGMPKLLRKGIVLLVKKSRSLA